MTEKEKCHRGMLYDANNDEELLKERSRCKVLCHEYNSLNPSDIAGRRTILRELLGKTGNSFTIEQPFYCDYGYNIRTGENFYMNVNCTVLDGAEVVFGDNVFVGPGCGFHTAGHPLDPEMRNSGLEYAYPIRIGNNVWIGAGAIVLPGVSIGDNTVIGAGSVVTRDVPADVVAAGNPCRIIRYLRHDNAEDSVGIKV